MRVELVSGLLIVSCAALACGDPVHDRAVAALGGEAPGVPEGPLHRPGQPCATCHGPEGPASGEFSIAGTVYALLSVSEPVPNVMVRIRDITGNERSTTTNQAGNFFIRTSEWQPIYPLQTSIRLGTLSKQMSTYIARAASCADCHVHPPGPTSPGHIYIATSRTELGGGADAMTSQTRLGLGHFARALLASALLLSACSEAPSDTRIGIFAPNASEEAFGPVGDFLGHRCGSLDCHGSQVRNLRIWSCQGMRLAATDAAICSRAKGGRRTTPEEHFATYRSLVGLEPVVMSTVVESGGENPELLTFVRKARGTEAHKGGALIAPGDAQDQCITTWLSGQTNLKACGDAFVQPKFPPAPSSP